MSDLNISKYQRKKRRPYYKVANILPRIRHTLVLSIFEWPFYKGFTVLGNTLCDLDPKLRSKVKKADICDGVPSTAALDFTYPIYLKSFLNMYAELPSGFRG